MVSKSPQNACRRCGATAYKPVLARDASGSMRPSGVYRCVGCKLEFTHIQQWRWSNGSETAEPLLAVAHPAAT